MEDCLRVDEVDKFARIFPTAIAGNVKFFEFDLATNEAVLVYQPDGTIEQPTVLSVPVQWRFPGGEWAVSVAPETVVSYTIDNNEVSVALTEQWAGEEVSIVIGPKQ